MIRYPFLIDQVLIRNPRNGTNIVLSRDEARRLAGVLNEIVYEMPDDETVRSVREESESQRRFRIVLS